MPHYSVNNPIDVKTIKSVYCDGQKIKAAIECDTDNGWVKYYPKDEDNNFIIEEDEFVVHTLHGTVEVYFNDE